MTTKSTEIYGQAANDVIFGDAQDDNIILGWGHDWISAGTGTDGVIGDDGRIYTSRNSTIGESLRQPGAFQFRSLGPGPGRG